MQRRKNTPFNVTLIGLLLCLAVFAPSVPGAHIMSPFYTKLTCHFCHANLLHWFCNSMCLWLMRPSPSQIAWAFPYAVIAMFFTTEPTIGFSAVIYAYLGMNIFRWKISLVDWATFIVANIISACLPNIAWQVHLAAFLFGWATYYTQKQINRILLTLGM